MDEHLACLEHDFSVTTTSELQVAFMASRAEAPDDDSSRIGELLTQGKFLVVVSRPYYCPRTDAYMKRLRHIVSVHDERPTEDIIDWNCYSEEDMVEILPELPRPTPTLPPSVFEGQDIPF